MSAAALSALLGVIEAVVNDVPTFIQDVEALLAKLKANQPAQSLADEVTSDTASLDQTLNTPLK